MPYMPFTPAEVRLIFELSEASVGHSGERHVSITNAGLARRVQDYSGAGLALRTVFLTFDDQVQAALQLLNDPRHDAALEQFRVNKKPGRPYVEIVHSAPVPVRMRYGIGDGAHVFPCRDFKLVLDKNGARPRGMQIVTFYGTMGPMV